MEFLTLPSLNTTIKPSLPAIGGGEGVGEVLSVGPEVKNLKIGDWVFPGGNMKGTKYGDNRYATIGSVEYLKYGSEEKDSSLYK